MLELILAGANVDQKRNVTETELSVMVNPTPFVPCLCTQTLCSVTLHQIPPSVLTQSLWLGNAQKMAATAVGCHSAAVVG